MSGGAIATILLTGAGGAAVPGLIDGLRGKGHRVIAADMDPQAAGLYIADHGYVIPAGHSEEFVQAVRKIVDRESVDVFIPLVDEELIASTDLQSGSLAVITPRKDFVVDCLDKYRLMTRFGECAIPHPATCMASQWPCGLSYPLVLKPRTGRGSRNVVVVHDEEEMRAALEQCPLKMDEMIIQEYVEGPEYTVSVVAWRDGAVQAVVPKQIICKRGVTKLARTCRSGVVDEICRQVQERMGADGPFNVQLRIDKEGTPRIFEINPRYSTTVSLTIASGVDEVGALVDQALGQPPAPMEWKEGVVLVRRTLDLFVEEKDFNDSVPTAWEVV